jgi:hypothetical protein
MNSSKNEKPSTTNTKNLLMNEIQEILSDQDIVKKKLIEKDNEYYILELTFPEEITQKNFKIKFKLMINKEYPNVEPEVYCLTVFSHPHLCDGRNLINTIINGEWSNNTLPLETIINKIPKFIIKYNEYKDNYQTIGKYVLGKYYKINFLKELPIYFHLVSRDNKILTISDISLCLYDLDNNIGYCKLSFYTDIKCLIEVKSNKKKNLIIFTYKDIVSNKKNKMKLNTPNNENITAVLKEKMKIYEKKSGKLPDININKVEKEIEEKEKELKDNYTDIDKNLYLMSLYQKAVEYYSAINNPKFIEITNKIHNLLRYNNNTNQKKEELSEKEDVHKNESNITNKDNQNEIAQKQNNNNNDNSNNDNNKKEIKEKEKDHPQEEKKNNIKENDIKQDNKAKDVKKEEDKKDKIESKKEEEKNNNKSYNKVEVKNIKDNKKDNKKDDKEKKENTKESKKNDIEKKDNKDDKKKQGLRLKIDEGELGTLDVGDEEDEEEEEEEK